MLIVFIISSIEDATSKPVSPNIIITDNRIPLPSFERISKRDVADILPVMELVGLTLGDTTVKPTRIPVLKNAKSSNEQEDMQDLIKRDYREEASNVP